MRGLPSLESLERPCNGSTRVLDCVDKQRVTQTPFSCKTSRPLCQQLPNGSTAPRWGRRNGETPETEQTLVHTVRRSRAGWRDISRPNGPAEDAGGSGSVTDAGLFGLRSLRGHGLILCRNEFVFCTQS